MKEINEGRKEGERVKGERKKGERKKETEEKKEKGRTQRTELVSSPWAPLCKSPNQNKKQ